VQLPVGEEGTFCKHCVAVALEEAGPDRRSKRPDRSNDEEPDVGGYGHPLGHQVLLDHVDQVGAGDVLGVAAGHQGGGVEVGRTLELDDACRDAIGVALLLVGVLEELLSHRARIQALGHVEVALVAQQQTSSVASASFKTSITRSRSAP